MDIKEMIAKLVIIHFVASVIIAYAAYMLGFFTLDQILTQLILLAIPFPITILMAIPSTLGLVLALIVMWATGDFSE